MSQKKDLQILHTLALDVQKMAHAPYSNFRVGVALQSGQNVFLGCNVENASYGGTICAERTAITKAVSEGIKSFDRLVLVSDSKTAIPPCGMCLQVLAEFCGPKFEVVAYPKSKNGKAKKWTLGKLLPQAFRKNYL